MGTTAEKISTIALAKYLHCVYSGVHGRSAQGAAENERAEIMKTQHTAGEWQIKKSFNGYVITRTWSSGFYQRMKTPHLRTEDEAIAFLASA